jgi:ABC-2 type transport system permease protein
MTTIKKYFRIYRVLFSNSLSFEAQYRYDTIIKLLANLLWVGMMFIIIEVIFSHTTAIAGWSKPEMYLMTIFWIIADELYVALFGNNLPAISEYITHGELDQFLTKPVAPLFLVSCRSVLIRSFYRLGTQLLILGWFVWHFDVAVSGLHVVMAALLIIVAVSVDYARVLFANTFSFWFLRIENINEAIGALHSFGKYPLSIWPKTIKIVFLTALPVAFSGFIPVATLTGRWPWYGILYAFLFAGLLCLLAVKFWHFALKRYSSASS